MILDNFNKKSNNLTPTVATLLINISGSTVSCFVLNNIFLTEGSIQKEYFKLISFVTNMVNSSSVKNW